jgi:hypothetical protein
MTKTLRPVFRLPEAAALDAAGDEAAALDAAADVDATADELDELDELELQAAARPTVAITGSVMASFLARLRFISLNPFNSVADRCSRALDSMWRLVRCDAQSW